MASEDSDQILPGCLPVHRFGDLRDLDETVDIEMSTGVDDPHTTRESFEVELLRRPERVSFEERQYRSKELRSPVHDELAQMLTMIVMALSDEDPTSSEEALQLLQRRPAPDALRHDEPMRHLKPGFVASATSSAWLPNESDGEATLSVYKASDPARLNQPFLLIVCTRSHYHGSVRIGRQLVA